MSSKVSKPCTEPYSSTTTDSCKRFCIIWSKAFGKLKVLSTTWIGRITSPSSKFPWPFCCSLNNSRRCTKPTMLSFSSL
ncbi:Uncharacterised protein [Vibrio cholerae]|nr:Uncharacterised protein [Vibrio cholerae]